MAVDRKYFGAQVNAQALPANPDGGHEVRALAASGHSLTSNSTAVPGAP